MTEASHPAATTKGDGSAGSGSPSSGVDGGHVENGTKRVIPAFLTQSSKGELMSLF